MRVRTGLDVLCEERRGELGGRRLAVLCHPASVDGRLVHAIDRLLAAGARIVRLFGPEHGVRGEAQDMVGVADAVDPTTRIPVTSLYGASFASLSPPPGSLDDADALVIDLQDIGSRYYTYVWTMALAMEAAARAGKAVLVLDRPNPLGGDAIEGGDVEPGFESFVGLGSVPVRHGLTIGEVARMVAAGMPWSTRFPKPLDVDLQVVAMQGWSRAMAFEATGLPWVLPSPNMPTPETAFVYPGMCLLEGTNLSEGRGTTRPFEIVGAPFLDGAALAAALARADLPGVVFRALSFRPTFHKHQGQACGGVQLHVLDRARFRPYLTGVAFLAETRRLAGDAFAWRREAYEFVTDKPAIDLLTGGEAVRRGVDGGQPLAEIAASWAAAEAAFAERRAAHLLYRG